LALGLSLAPSSATADEPSLFAWTQARVQEGLLRPLAEHEAPRFSRRRPVPRERRIRVLGTAAICDASGRSFVPFAIDSRFAGGDWQDADIVGCAYLGQGDLYVKRGEGYRPVEFLFGKNVDPVPGACEAAPVPPKAK
jgi:hypothetical protein